MAAALTPAPVAAPAAAEQLAADFAGWRRIAADPLLPWLAVASPRRVRWVRRARAPRG